MTDPAGSLTVAQKQQLLPRLISQLIDFIYATPGYTLSFGEAYRTPEQAALDAKAGTGIRNSEHTKRLAVDFNLFLNGEWQKDSEAHRPFGQFWKSLNPLCCWGGDFADRPDGNHYSLSDEGVK